ncbi:hypothetical protein XBKB1_1150024 [Xenorhabdus bovienii str. kraussei Becker Underwood]|uniref:Uncharacterized protein n=1 Tax=Xenorhabdus bovienii str. kraussei Becker Underwood TaxID=1398204 RepID=A0A077PPA0_XENBV|nr:hypothetical protein XBKB1_1150024 [Xenorhabdus bovienii str. kraussei Becker Underwood]
MFNILLTALNFNLFVNYLIIFNKLALKSWCPDSESNQGHGDFQSHRKLI